MRGLEVINATGSPKLLTNEQGYGALNEREKMQQIRKLADPQDEAGRALFLLKK